MTTDPVGSDQQYGEIQRRTVLQLALAGGVVGRSIPLVSGDEGEGALTEGPEVSTSSKTETKTTPDDVDASVLLVKNCDPWDVPANEIALEDLGYAYDRLTAESLVDRQGSDLDLDDYEVLLIPTTQSEAYYHALSALSSAIDGFVDAGGTLIVHAGERGWPCGISGSLLEFPGKVDNKYTFDLQGGEEIPELQELDVLNEDHPVADGFDGEDLSYWANDISSFGHFEGLPADARRVVGLEIDPDRFPSYVEYPFGDGRVLATMQGPEWPFGDPEIRDGTEQLLKQELEYAVETDPQPAPDPAPSKGRLAGSVHSDSDGPVEDSDVYLVDPTLEYQVVEYIDGDRDDVPEHILHRSTDEHGDFHFEDIEPMRYLVLVVPPAPFFPAFDRVAVTADETTRTSIEVERNRYLSTLDSELDRLRDAADQAVVDSTYDVADVYVDGASFFSYDLDLEDYLKMGLEVTNFAMGLKVPDGSIAASVQIKSFMAEQTTLPVAEYGYHKVLANEWDDVHGTQYQGELYEYTDKLLGHDWFVSLKGASSVPKARKLFSGTNEYQGAQDDIVSLYDYYDQDVAYREPADDFSVGEVRSVLRSQATALEGNGIASGTSITPTGSSYVTRETAYHKGYYDGLRADFQATEALDTAATGIALGGKSLMVTGVGASVGAVASVAGDLGSLAIQMYQVKQQNRIADAWINSVTYWESDLNDVPAVFGDLVNWLSEEVDAPTLQGVDGRIADVDLGGIEVGGTIYALANEPDYPDWWWGTELSWKRRATNEVTLENTGSTAANVRAISVDTYGDGRNAGVSDAVSQVPQENDPAERLAPGESTMLEHEYASDFHPFSPFNWHYMSTVLWMNGKSVDEIEQPYYIVPSLDLLPGPLDRDEASIREIEAAASPAELLGRPIRTDSYMLTDGSKSEGEPLTVDDWTEYVGEIEPLIDTEVRPDDPAVSTTYEVGSEASGVVFVLGTTPDAELNLHVHDEEGNHVGYDPATDSDVVEIPGAEYNGHESTIEIVSIEDASGSYSVATNAVSFATDSPVSASLYTVDIPGRDGVLSVLSDAVNTFLSPDGSTTSTIEVGEVGGQVDVDVTDVRTGTFTTVNGDPLEGVDVGVDPQGFDLGAGEKRRIDLQFDWTPSVSLPETPETRFSAPVEVESAQAGTGEVRASVLLLRTDVKDATLENATKSVEGVTFTGLDRDELPRELPDGVEFDAGYQVDAVGDGRVAVSVPAGFKEPTLLVLEADGWRSKDAFVEGNEIVVRTSVPADKLTVAVVETLAPDVTGNGAEATDPNGDGLYEDVNGDGEFNILDVQALYANLDKVPVQDNAELFDFSGDGQVNILDVQALYAML